MNHIFFKFYKLLLFLFIINNLLFMLKMLIIKLNMIFNFIQDLSIIIFNNH